MTFGAALAPLTLTEFERRLGEVGLSSQEVGAPRRYIAAVSGGRDSMALARLAAEHARKGAEVLAVTVDHGLRAGSRAEAEQVGAWCRSAGLAHHILEWTGDKPAAGRQEAARRARYRLLAACAEAEGFPAILTAHTADDQAETVLMRLARGSGPTGLAGMSEATMIAAGPGEAIALLRPFLDVARERLHMTAAAYGQSFIDDPSNDDPAFERVRARALLGALEEQGLLTRAALLRTAARARRSSRLTEAADERAFHDAGGCFHAGGWASLAGARFAAAPASMLARLIGAVSGSEHPPPEEDAAAALAACVGAGAATLGGALILRKGEAVFVMREPAAVLGRAGAPRLLELPVSPGGRILWDGRFIIENSGRAPLLIRPLGPEGVAALGPAKSLYAAPDEALVAAPAAFFATDSSLNPGKARLRSLAAERFSARVVRHA